MSLTGKIQCLFADKERTKAIFPVTKISAISDNNGVGLDALLEDFATEDYVAAEIAKAQLEGDDIDLSGYATKEDLDNLNEDLNGLNEKLGNLVGKDVSGETFVVDDESIVALDGAEIFNDYENNIATGEHSHAEGCYTIATGDYSHAEGDCCIATGYAAHAEGSSAEAHGNYSHAENYGFAYGENSHAEGYENCTFEDSDHAEGMYTQAKGGASHTEGDSTVTYGFGAHAEGCGSIAYGGYSHAEGWCTFAYGNEAHAEGSRGYYSTRVYITGAARSRTYTLDKAYNIEIGSQIDCIYTNEDNISIHASSLITSYDPNALTIKVSKTLNEDMDFSSESADIYIGGIAYGDKSHVEGEGCIAGSENQHVQGRFNIRDDDDIYAHIVGNGEQPDRQLTTRSNAHTLDWDGNAWFAGDVYVGSTSGINKDEGSKKLATEDYVATMAASFKPDWNQNDETAADYIKNRPFYTGDLMEVETDINAITEWYTDEYIDGTNCLWYCSASFTLEEGKEYSIVINGNRYTSTSVREVLLGEDVIYFGDNYESYTSGLSSDFTYTVVYFTRYGYANVYYIGAETPTECKIYSSKQEVVKIDPKYLPDGGIGYSTIVDGMVLAEEQTVEGFDVFEESIYTATCPFTLDFTNGNVFTVTWDGVSYDVECALHTIYGLHFVGNENYVNFVADGEIPFCILDTGSDILILTASTEASHTIKVLGVGEEVHKINPKYLPEIDIDLPEVTNPDWEQNDSYQGDYIKNRPFYEEVKSDFYLISCENEFYDNELSYLLPNSTTILEGETYLVIFDSVTYKCKAWADYTGSICLGNGDIYNYWNNRNVDRSNDEPFCLELNSANEMLLYVSEAGYHYVTVNSAATIIHKIDPKYLPEGGVGYVTTTRNDVVLVEEQSIYIDESLYTRISDSLTFIEGETYWVTFDGMLYGCIARYGEGAYGVVYIGNGENRGLQGNGEPFYFESFPSGECILCVYETGTHTIKIDGKEEYIHKINPKYLPEPTTHEHSAENITSGVLSTTYGGTGYASITDTTYTTARYRASSLHSTETTPTINGVIAWTYE